MEFFQPNEGTPVVGVTGTETYNPKRTGSLPNRATDLIALARRVLAIWDVDNIRLIWTDKGTFEVQIDEYDTYLTSGKSAGASRREITKELRLLNQRVNVAVSDLKRLLVNKYKSDYKSYLEYVGIKVMNGRYTFPTNQQDRRKALEMICTFVANNPAITTPELNLSHWQEMLADFSRYIDSAVNTDNTVTDSSIKKGQHKEAIIKTLNSVINILKANYPDNYIQEIRKRGFHKEKY